MVAERDSIRFVTCIVCGCQLWLYGHMARFVDADPAHQILAAREPREWRPIGQPRASWLQQIDQHLKEMGMGQALSGGWPDGGPWSTGGKWTQRCAAPTHAPIPDLTLVEHQSFSKSHYSTPEPSCLGNRVPSNRARR